MTVGEQIQTLRKAAGLSQEALGEQLNVTRQSISKWESDQAMPEVEKLVTMSRLFGVSVGGLLQVEAPPAPGGERPRRRWPLVAAGLTLALLLGLIVVLFLRIAFLEDRISTVNAVLSVRIGELTAPPPAESLFADAACTLTGLNAGALTAEFSLRAAPNVAPRGTKVAFLAQLGNGARYQIAGVADESGTQFTVPVSDSVTFFILLDDGTQTLTEELHPQPIIDGLDAACRLHVESLQNGSYREGGVWRLKASRNVMVSRPSVYGLDEVKADVSPASAGIEIYKNDVLQKTIPVPVDSSAGTSDGFWSYSVRCDAELPVASGDSISVVTYAVDNYGRRTEATRQEE